MQHRKVTFAATMIATAATLVACGGGGGGGGSNADTTGNIPTTPGGRQPAQPAEPTVTPAALVSTVADANYNANPRATEKAAVFTVLNDDRARCGFGKLAQNTQLDVAAQAHANYQSMSGVIGHTETAGVSGYTGTNSRERIVATGYPVTQAGENIGTVGYGTSFASSLYLPFPSTELSAVNALRGLYATVYHLSSLMYGYRDVGIGISIRDNSSVSGTAFLKILNINSAVASGTAAQTIAGDGLATFPCEGTSNLNPYFTGETPDPFPDVNRDVTPYGQPIYLMSAQGTTLTLTSGVINKLGTPNPLATRVLTAANDPKQLLKSNEVFLVPTSKLDDNTSYTVNLTGTSTGMVSTSNPSGAFNRVFTFRTGTFTTE